MSSCNRRAQRELEVDICRSGMAVVDENRQFIWPYLRVVSDRLTGLVVNTTIGTYEEVLAAPVLPDQLPRGKQQSDGTGQQ